MAKAARQRDLGEDQAGLHQTLLTHKDGGDNGGRGSVGEAGGMAEHSVRSDDLCPEKGGTGGTGLVVRMTLGTESGGAEELGVEMDTWFECGWNGSLVKGRGGS